MVSWEIDREKTEDHWLELKDPDGWYQATVRWDGCIHYERVYNAPLPITGEHPQSSDYIHFCDIDSEIERLEKLRDMAREFFGTDWE